MILILKSADRREHFWNVIRRIDAYTRSTNTKAGVVATFNSLILGTTARCLENVTGQVESLSAWTGCSLWWLIVPATLSGFSLLFTVLAVLPYLGSDDEEDYTSLIFFQDIALKEVQAYVNQVKKIDEDAAIEDLSRQAYALAEGASQKFFLLKIAFWFLIGAGLSILVLYPFYLQ